MIDYNKWDFKQNVELQSSMLTSEQRFLAITLLDELQVNKYAQKNDRIFSECVMHITKKAMNNQLKKNTTLKHIVEEILDLHVKEGTGLV